MVKREIIQSYQLVLDGTVSVYGDTGWYLVVQGQYRAFMPVYILKVEILPGVTEA